MNRYMTQVSNDGKTWENVEGMPGETLMSAKGATRQSMIDGLMSFFKCTFIRVISPTENLPLLMWEWPNRKP